MGNNMLEGIKIRGFRKMLKIPWTERVTNKKVLDKIKKQRKV